MRISDPIADMLIRIQNALSRGKRDLVMPHSKFKQGLADVLVKHGWLEKVEAADGPDGFKQLRLVLKYDAAGTPTIHGLKRVSKPGRRIYASSSEIPHIRFGTGTTVVSTSNGLMTDDEARKAKVGGEVLCQIW